MTARRRTTQWLLEVRETVLAGIARRVMTTRRSGLDGLAKRLLERTTPTPVAPDADLEHPKSWDRPID